MIHRTIPIISHCRRRMRTPNQQYPMVNRWHVRAPLQAALAAITPIAILCAFTWAGENPCARVVASLPTKNDIPADAPAEMRNLIVQTFSADGGERLEALKRLRAYGTRAVPVIPFLMRMLDDDSYCDKNGDCSCNEAFDTILELREAAVETLMAGLANPQQPGKSDIALLLGVSGDHRAVPALICALCDPDHGVRDVAVESLGRIADKRAVEPLIALLRDPDPRLVNSAAHALGRIGDDRALKPLLDILTNRRGASPKWLEARIGAAAGVGLLRSRHAFEPLLAIWKDPTEPKELRNDAIQWLGYTKDPRAFEILRAATDDIDRDVYLKAFYGLAALGDDRSVALLKAKLTGPREMGNNFCEDYRIGVVKALIEANRPDSIDAAIVAFEASRDFRFRGLAVDFLMMSSNPRAYLRAAAALQENDPWVACEAARVLVQNTHLMSEDSGDVYNRTKRLPALKDPRVLSHLMALVKSQGSIVTHHRAYETGPLASPGKRDTVAHAYGAAARGFAKAALRRSASAEALQFLGPERK